MYIKKFDNFSKSRKIIKLFEAVLNIDDSVKSVLDEFISDKSEDPKFSKIALSIKNSIGNDYKSNRYDMVDFSNDKKLLQVKTGKQTNTQGVAKVIRTILMAIDQDFFKSNPDIKDDTIQKFADKFIGRIPNEDTSINEGDFKIVSGDDIKFWYDRKNMKVKSGSELDKSCMAQGYKLGFIDFYCQNSSVKLVIKLDTDGKLVARALLWKLESCSDKKSWFLDRCYCNDNSDEESIYGWLKSNTEYSNLNRRDSKKINAGSGCIMTVKLDKTITKYYPYLDTFKFLYVKYEDGKLLDQGFLSNKNSNESDPYRVSEIESESPIEFWKEFDPKRVSDIQDGSYKIFKLQSTEGLRNAINPEDKEFNNKNMIKVIVGLNIDTEDYDKPLGDAKTIIRAMGKFRESGDFASLFKLDVIDSDQDFDEDKFVLFQDSTYMIPEISVDVIDGRSKFFKCLSLRAYDVSKLDIWNDELSKIYDIIKPNTIDMPEDKKIMTELDLIILGKLDKVDKSKVYYLNFQDLKYSRIPIEGISGDKRLEMVNEILNKNSKNDEALELRNKLINIE
jgi:hypothetical protein